MIASSFHMLQTRTNKTTWLKWLRHIVRTMQNGQGMDHESLYFEGWSVFRHLLSVQLGKMRAASTSCFRLISEESKHVNLFLIFSLFGPDSKPSKGNINSGSDLGKLQKNPPKSANQTLDPGLTTTPGWIWCNSFSNSFNAMNSPCRDQWWEPVWNKL